MILLRAGRYYRRERLEVATRGLPVAMYRQKATCWPRPVIAEPLRKKTCRSEVFKYDHFLFVNHSSRRLGVLLAFLDPRRSTVFIPHSRLGSDVLRS